MRSKKMVASVVSVAALVSACSGGSYHSSGPTAGQSLPPPAASSPETLLPPNGEPYDDVFFDNAGVNPFIDTEDDHLSTFALDVDTGSYTVARRYLGLFEEIWNASETSRELRQLRV